MGIYADYVSENYPREDDIAELLFRHKLIIEKYFPDETLANKISHAKGIENRTPAVWLRERRENDRTAKLGVLRRRFKHSPSPKGLAKLVAFYVKYSAEDLAREVDVMGQDAADAALSLTDIRKVRSKRERAEQEELFATRQATKQGVYEGGEGPGVFFRRGLVGLPVAIVKKGTDLMEVGLTEATRNGSVIQCFAITDRGISVIKKPGQLREWLDLHRRHYLVRLDAGITSDVTGQDRWLQKYDKEASMPWQPLDDPAVIGVTVKPWKGLYLEEERYEVIDPGLLMVKQFAEQAQGFAETGAETLLKAPNEIAEAVRGVGGTAKTAKEAFDSFMELLGEDEAKGEFNAVQVTFTPVGGTLLSCEDPEQTTFLVDGVPARGVRIGAIADEVLSLLD